MMITILRNLNLFAMLSTVFPYLMLLNGWSNGNVYTQYVYLLLIGVNGYFFQRKVVEKTTKIGKRMFLLIVESTLIFTIPFFLFEYNIFHLIFLAVLSEFNFLFGRKLSVITIKQILSIKLNVFIWCSNIFVPIICYWNGYDFDITIVFVVSIVLIFSRMFMLNLDRIDTLSTDRGHELSDIPTKLRQHNLTLVGGMFVTILGITLFLEDITSTLNIIGVWCYEKFKDFLRWLVSKISDDPTDYDPLTQEVEDSVPTIFDELMLEEEVLRDDKYLDTLLFILTFATIIWLIFSALKVIIPIIVRFIKNNLNTNSNSITTIDDDTWTVVETKIVKEDTLEEDITVKKWRKEYKKYIKSAVDFHQGYKLALSGIYLLEKNITRSDTPLEISDKIILDELKNVTNLYNTSTYGEVEVNSTSKSILLVLANINDKI